MFLIIYCLAGSIGLFFAEKAILKWHINIVTQKRDVTSGRIIWMLILFAFVSLQLTIFAAALIKQIPGGVFVMFIASLRVIFKIAKWQLNNVNQKRDIATSHIISMMALFGIIFVIGLLFLGYGIAQIVGVIK